jgi:hypothetical protein
MAQTRAFDHSRLMKPCNTLLSPPLWQRITVSHLEYWKSRVSDAKTIDRIPIPEIGDNGRNLCLTTSTERKAIHRIFGQQPAHEVQSKLGVLLDSNALTDM